MEGHGGTAEMQVRRPMQRGPISDTIVNRAFPRPPSHVTATGLLRRNSRPLAGGPNRIGAENKPHKEQHISKNK